MVDGIESSITGFAGGAEHDADYYRVASGGTGHAEAVQLVFDTAKLSLADVFDIFWVIHDPTTLNRQGHDVGPQYRSAIFYASPQQKTAAEAAIASAQTLWSDPIVTEVAPLDRFYPAEEIHQDYFAKNPEAGYCQVVINPKLQKLRESFASRLRAS
jgi:peptide-methionine (S)-S-oxide reductase